MILLIGGCGYAGTALYDHFMSYGCDVWSADLEWFGKTIPENQKVDYAELEAWELKKYDTIVLTAGHSSIQMCENKAAEAHRNNVTNFIDLLDKLHPHQKLIYFSSSSVYAGLHEASEFTTLPAPKNIYDITKREIDYYAMNSGKRVFGLRLGTINGFSRNLRVDIMINKMVFSAKTNGYIEVSNVNFMRPILDISDMCRAVSVLAHAEFGGPGIFNVASFNANIGTIATAVANVMGVDVLYRGETDNALDFSMDLSLFSKKYSFFPKESNPWYGTRDIALSLDQKMDLYGSRESIDY